MDKRLVRKTAEKVVLVILLSTLFYIGVSEYRKVNPFFDLKVKKANAMFTGAINKIIGR